MRVQVKNSTWWLRLTAVAWLLAVSGCAWLHDQQRLLIYRPTLSTTGSATLAPTVAKLYWLDVPGQNVPMHLALWWLAQPHPDAPTLLYLHGTFRNLEGNAHKINALYQAGFSVLAVDYRGWGQSSVLVPSEESILEDARLTWAELVRYEPRAAKRVIYGHSMGSGVAVDLASHLSSPADYAGLILESAFSSFDEVAAQAGWWVRLLNAFNSERFDSISKITKVRAPLLMLHGGQDDTIPIRLGERLFAAANAPKQWLGIDTAAHSDLNQVNPALYQATLQGFSATYLSGQ